MKIRNYRCAKNCFDAVASGNGVVVRSCQESDCRHNLQDGPPVNTYIWRLRLCAVLDAGPFQSVEELIRDVGGLQLSDKGPNRTDIV